MRWLNLARASIYPMDNGTRQLSDTPESAPMFSEDGGIDLGRYTSLARISGGLEAQSEHNAQAISWRLTLLGWLAFL